MPAPDQSDQVGPTSGRVSDGIYSNDYFEFKLPIPKDWYVASSNVQDHIMETGKRVVSESSAPLKAAVEASKQHTYNLLSVFEHAPGTPVEFNPNVICMAERVAHLPGIRTGKDYLFHMKRGLLATQLPYEFKADAHSVNLGKNAWDRADAALNIPNQPVSQSYFATKRGEFVLIFILSAATPEQMKLLEEVVASVEFDEAESN